MAVSLSATPATAAVQWEQTSCPLCRSQRWSTLLEAPDFEAAAATSYTVVRCRECGLCFTSPRPSPASMGQFYGAAYRPHRLAEPALGPTRGRRWFRLPVGLDRRRPEKGDLAPHGRCRLLDFGCGGGTFLRRMHDRGWQVLGLDLSEAAVRRVRRELGLRALVGTLPHPHLSPESYDVITMWQSLEHVHRPLEVLQQAYRLLAPGGKLIAAVPNIDSAPFRWFGPAWFGLDLPRHLTHFSAATLRRMLERAGFHVAAVRMVRHNAWLRASARRACRLRPAPRRLRWLRAGPLCRPASLYCLLTGQSDCVTAIALKPARRSAG
jgi:2-polyprenyl-3-methyl-5-hydroxy-6-metoxy-1,4-benzoquinol methylase